MSQQGEPTHRFSGTPLSEWILLVPNELPIDAVGLWQIAPVFEHDFGLSGPALEEALRQTVRGLLAAGAIAVEMSPPSPRWVARSDLAGSGEDCVNRVVQYWRDLGREPDVGDVWFALASEVG